MVNKKGCLSRLVHVAVFQRAFQYVRQKQSGALKLCMDSIGRPPCCRYSCCFQYLSGLAMEVATERVEEVALFQWGEGSQQQRIDVHRPVARRPFEPPQPTSDVRRRGKLATPIARQAKGSHRDTFRR